MTGVFTTLVFLMKALIREHPLLDALGPLSLQFQGYLAHKNPPPRMTLR